MELLWMGFSTLVERRTGKSTSPGRRFLDGDPQRERDHPGKAHHADDEQQEHQWPRGSQARKAIAGSRDLGASPALKEEAALPGRQLVDQYRRDRDDTREGRAQGHVFRE